MKPALQFTPLDLRQWERGEMFSYFSRMAPTGYSLTVQLDVTALRRILRKAGYKFFPAYLWLATRLLSRQKEFSIAEKEGQLGYYNVLTPLYAAFHPSDHTFSLLWTEYDDVFPAFHQSYLADQAAYGDCRGVLGKPGQLPPPNAYTVSCVPWISFQAFSVHSYENKPYYFPSLEAGRFIEENGRTLLPLSITCHHAATDGWHVSRFLADFQAAADGFAMFL